MNINTASEDIPSEASNPINYVFNDDDNNNTEKIDRLSDKFEELISDVSIYAQGAFIERDNNEEDKLYTSYLKSDDDVLKIEHGAEGTTLKVQIENKYYALKFHWYESMYKQQINASKILKEANFKYTPECVYFSDTEKVIVCDWIDDSGEFDIEIARNAMEQAKKLGIEFDIADNHILGGEDKKTPYFIDLHTNNIPKN